MLKHIGRHGDKRCVIIFREVPGEDHMALVTYPDQLNSQVHDDLMNCVQSNAGQAAKDLGEAAHRVVGTNGQNLLETIHREGFMKKVRTQDIILVPAPNQDGARLDEINQIIRELETGSEAAQRMAQLDANAGLADPDKKAAGVQAAAEVAGVSATATTSSPDAVLDDASLARNLVAQADQMKQQMAGLEAEMQRLMAEAAELDPSVAVKKRGRPKKAQ